VSASVAQPRGTPRTWSERLAVAWLGLAIVLGSALLWIGVPVAGLWLAGAVMTTPLRAVMFALIAIPATMALLAFGLYRAGDRYERLRGTGPPASSPPAWRSSLSEERASDRRRKGGRPLIDIAMTASAATATVVLTVWFFFFAESMLSPLP
jgi:hypothetical protein